MAFTASQLGAQHKRDSVENKPASMLVVSLGKVHVLNGMPPSLHGRQVVGPSSLTENLQTEHELLRNVYTVHLTA